jgi:hypothetical protein
MNVAEFYFLKNATLAALFGWQIMNSFTYFVYELTQRELSG